MTNSVHGILKLYPDKSLIAIISELTLVNNNVPVNAAPRACQLNMLGGDSTVDCNNPSTSSFSSPTSMTSVTSSSHSSRNSQSSTASQSTSTPSKMSMPSSISNTVTTTRNRPTATTRTTTSSLVDTTSYQALKTSLTSISQHPSSTSGSNGVFSVEMIAIVVLVALVGIMIGMMIVGCFYYMQQHKRGSGDVISTNNMSLHNYSPLDNHELGIDMEATFRATVDEDDEKMLQI